MKKTPFFSIVLPIYGVESYLAAALDDLLQQTFTDYEILLVNDASPDDSAAICEAYAAKYDTITLLTHPENRGLSGARNTGLAAARGEYIWFMDPDDRVDPTLLSQVHDSLVQHPADAVMFGCVEEYYDRHGNVVRRVPVAVPAAVYTTREEVIRALPALERATLFGYAWNKCYRLSHIRERGLQYESVVLIEDVVFNAAFFETASSLNVLDSTPYRYAKRSGGSLTARFVPEYYEVHRRRVATLYEQQCRFGNDTPEVRRFFGNLYVRYLFSALSRNCDKRAAMTAADRRAFLNAVFADDLFTALIPAAAPKSLFPKMMAWLLRGKRTTVCLATARVIFWIQTYLRPLFLRLKGQRE